QRILAPAKEPDPHLGAVARGGRLVGDPDRGILALRPGRPGHGNYQRRAVGRQRKLVWAGMPPGPPVTGRTDRQSRAWVSTHIRASYPNRPPPCGPFG